MKLAAGLTVLFVVGLAASPAAAMECPVPDAPEIRIEVATTPVREDRSLSFHQLSGIPSASRRGEFENYHGALGLTDAEYAPRAEIHLDTVASGNGYCSTARTALLTLKWQTVIYLAAQIPPGSCIDRTVLEHESKHVALDQRLIPIAEQAADIALRSVIRRGVFGNTVAESRRNLDNQVYAAINEAMSIFDAMRTRKQLMLDTKEEYEKVSLRCGIAEYIQVMRADFGT